MKRLYLQDAIYLDWRSLDVRRGHFAVEVGPGGGISEVEAIPAAASVVDCQGRIVTKSFAVGHHHAYSALARGMPPPSRTPKNFVEILELVWWNLDKQLDEAMVRVSALVVAMEAARCGSTFVIDHHASPNAVGGSLHVIAEAFDRVGVGHLLCYELSDRDGPERLQAGFEETQAWLQETGNQGLVGLHASFTVSDELLERAVALAKTHDTGIHIHVAEALSDQEHSREQYGVSVVERLDRAGVMALPQTVLAHCLHLDEAERARVRESRAWVVQNTESNQNNDVGRFEPGGLGDRLFLGTDGMHSDMLAAARACYLEGQSVGGLSPLDAYRRLRRVHDYIETNGFAGDADNNLVVLDYPSPTPLTSDNWAGHVIFGLGSQHVHTVISNGRVIVDAGRVTTVDADEILADASQQAQRLWKSL